MRIYVASSWWNTYQPGVVEELRAAGFSVYDFRDPEPGNNGFRWEDVDSDWQRWRPQEYVQALDHPVTKEADAIFDDFGRVVGFFSDWALRRGHWEATGEKRHRGSPPWPCREMETYQDRTFAPDDADPLELNFDDPCHADPQLDPWWDGRMDWEIPFE